MLLFPHAVNLLQKEMRPLIVISVCMQGPSFCSHSPGEYMHKSSIVICANFNDNLALYKETVK